MPQIWTMIRRIFIVFFILMVAFQAQAQFRLAPILGVNFNRQINKSNSYRFQPLFSSQLSYNVGVMGDLVITNFLSLQPEFLYTMKGGQYDSELGSVVNEHFQCRLGYLQMPVVLTAKLDLNKGYLFAGAGPYLSKLIFNSYNLKQDFVDVASGSLRVGTDLYSDQVKPWDAGIKTKIGIEYKKGFYLTAFYDIGTADIQPQFTVRRNKTIGVQTGFIFSLSEEDRYNRFENFYEF